MIPRANVTAWRRVAPWPEDGQVEQDLVLSRTLIEMYSSPVVAGALAFRGGTALQKLHVDPPARYSEDLDFVQRAAEPIGPVVHEIRAILDPWLGKPTWKAGRDRFTLHCRFETSHAPRTTRRVKIEINTREHFSVHGFQGRTYTVDNPWCRGSAEIVSYSLSELLGTKLRALYQRKKGRDLFDLALGLDHPELDVGDLVDAFEHYVANEGNPIGREAVVANVADKMENDAFRHDVVPLLRPGVTFDPMEAWDRVRTAIVVRLRGRSGT